MSKLNLYVMTILLLSNTITTPSDSSTRDRQSNQRDSYQEYLGSLSQDEITQLMEEEQRRMEHIIPESSPEERMMTEVRYEDRHRALMTQVRRQLEEREYLRLDKAVGELAMLESRNFTDSDWEEFETKVNNNLALERASDQKDTTPVKK